MNTHTRHDKIVRVFKPLSIALIIAGALWILVLLLSIYSKFNPTFVRDLGLNILHERNDAVNGNYMVNMTQAHTQKLGAIYTFAFGGGFCAIASGIFGLLSVAKKLRAPFVSCGVTVLMFLAYLFFPWDFGYAMPDALKAAIPNRVIPLILGLVMSLLMLAASVACEATRTRPERIPIAGESDYMPARANILVADSNE
ncbi:MAG: hypothetical protein LBN30_04435 [Oscillospiraceae bacterium]|jgi:hypothetical protein|nr:hypothetical protein [Oscillospiraceae bacterium]